MPKKTWILIAVVAGLAAIAALVYFVTSSFGGQSAQLRTLDTNAQKWYSLYADHYQVKVNIGCFCPFSDRMPVTVEVRDGRIVQAIDSQGNDVPEDDFLRTIGDDDLLTVEGLFAYARRAIREADKVEIAYDPRMHYPASVNVDWIEMAIDDEMSVQILELQLLP
jgi:hypothetical protein